MNEAELNTLIENCKLKTEKLPKFSQRVVRARDFLDTVKMIVDFYKLIDLVSASVKDTP